jgi:large subunit ribosomal protein L6
VRVQGPEGITIETPTQTEILVKGADKQRSAKWPPRSAVPSAGALQGQGRAYSGEKIIMKEAKKA